MSSLLIMAAAVGHLTTVPVTTAPQLPVSWKALGYVISHDAAQVPLITCTRMRTHWVCSTRDKQRFRIKLEKEVERK